MEIKFYKIISNPELNPTNNNYASLVCEGASKITDIWLEPVHERIHSKHFLFHANEICDRRENVKLEDYFFSTAKNYKNLQDELYLIEPITQLPGNYYPRIYRPILQKDINSMNRVTFSPANKILTGPFYTNDYFPCNENILIRSVQQLNILIDRLKSIFINIYPTSNNYNSFGHEIRNLLILSCTEVETQLKGILTENNILSCGNRYTTKDYIKLINVLELDKYSLRFPYYPEINPVTPFKDWVSNDPTKSLFWYDDYNSVKHNNESEFHRAKLTSTINAISAICILLVSQYGANMPYWTDLIGGFFEIVESPIWTFDDCYLPPFKGNKWTPQNYTYIS